MKPIFKFIIAVAIPLVVGSVAGFFTSSSVDEWFVTVDKPSFNPPNWVFAPVWTVLYILMGIAFFLVWRKSSPGKIRKVAFTLYFAQLFVNFIWSILFFYLHRPGWAFADILILWILIVLTMVCFARISSTARWLLVPYLAWVSFAAVLNYTIWLMN